MWLRSAYPQGVEGGSVSVGPYLTVVKSGPRGGRLWNPAWHVLQCPRGSLRPLPPPRGWLRNGAVRPGLLEAGGEERV